MKPKKSTLRRILAVGLLLAGLSFPASYLTAQTDLERADALYDKFICTCSCNLQLGICNMIACPNREPMKQELRAHLADGRSDAEILDILADKYGLTVLAAPPKTGAFNLSAWLMPFVVLLGGGGVAAFYVRRFRSRWTELPAQDGTAAEVSAFQQRLERELAEHVPED